MADADLAVLLEPCRQLAALEVKEAQRAFVAQIGETMEALLGQAVLQLVRVEHNIKEEMVEALGVSTAVETRRHPVKIAPPAQICSPLKDRPKPRKFFLGRRQGKDASPGEGVIGQ